jgi:hypothetical protein
MPKHSIYIIYVVFLISGTLFSQNPKKTLNTKFTSEKIIIDGKFDEASWKNAEIASDFLMTNPDNGKPEKPERKSEVKVIYTNEALYIAASLNDNEPSKIGKELALRDNFVTADHFGVQINGYNDGQQEFRFFVSAAGVQMDCVYTENNGEDFSWNAIWDSKTATTETGWVIEMKIPYAALRFPADAKQTWGINFYREIIRDRQQFTWNLMNNNINNEANQAGILEGIQNIKTPTRLFFIPYSSQYINANDSKKTNGEFKGGLDVKYGINDAFTLDAILVPDFGQTAFDRVELNLGPFEQQFNENRPFFTEGTELFNIGILVYSRRIGGNPSLNSQLNSNEIYVENPTVVNLLNALKISGRTKSGLGIGVLNAVTNKTVDEIRNTVTGETRLVTTEPIANYNVFVLDQRFRKNSSISLINTNVTRNGDFRDANVTALVYDLNTKSNSYKLSGDYKYSYVNDYQSLENKKGYNTSINFAKTKGKYRYSSGSQYVSDDWDNNDLGINFQSHYQSYYGNASYRILNPSKNFNSFSMFFNAYSEFDNRTTRIQGANINLQANFTTKKNDFFNFGISSKPVAIYDFYEPRSPNNERFLTVPKSINGFTYFSSNYNRKFAVDLNPSIGFSNEYGRLSYGLYVSPRYRFNDHFSLIYEFSYNIQKNNIGYVDEDTAINAIYIGRRDRTTFSNTVSSKYTINDLMNINLSVRHYLSYAEYNKYYNLLNDGSLEENPSFINNNDKSFATWNLDLSYSWWFAPGSQISILYRNNSYASQFGTAFDKDYLENLKFNLNNANLDHIFSISIRYFIDYNSIKNSK